MAKDKKPKLIDQVVGLARSGIRPPHKAYFYKPAAVWMPVMFTLGVALFAFSIVGPVYVSMRNGAPSGIDYFFPWGFMQTILAMVMMSHSILSFLMATGYFIIMGDGGIYHVENLEAVNQGPIVTAVDVPKHKKLGVRGRQVTVWKWGRLGGIRGVTAGGKKDGYVAMAMVVWFEDMEGNVLSGFKPDDASMERIALEFPARVMSNVMVCTLQPWIASSSQMPLELRLKIEHDWKWRPDSPVWVMYDPLPWKDFRVPEVTPAAIVALWGYTEAYNNLVIEHNQLAKEYAKLSTTFTLIGATQIEKPGGD